MRMLTDVDASTPYIRNSDYTDDSVSSPTVVDVLKRKIAPEKQALNEEELKKLLDNDELFLNALIPEHTEGEPPETEALHVCETLTPVVSKTEEVSSEN
jgi:hypothetical protein